MSRKKIETKDPIKEKQEELTNELTKLFEAIEAFSRLATVFEELNERIRKHRKKVESLGIELAELMGLENPTEK